jgi:hypothetical protein
MPSERSPPLPNGFFNWIGSLWKIPDVYALQHQSLDAYLYLRYMRMAMAMCFVGCCITWPILFPVNATGGGGQKELDILSYANIDSDNRSARYYALVFVGWLYFGFIMYMIMRECIFYINLRQAFLLSPFYSERISSRTVLFTSVPEEYRDDASLRKIFGNAAKNIWITGDTKEVDKLVEDRDKAAMRLEKAEVKLIKLANKARQAALKKGANPDDADKAPIAPDAESGSIAARWVPAAKRPTHRLGLLGLVGEKVDSIHWCRTELARLLPEVDAAQAKYRSGGCKKVPGVFIEFRTQSDAEGAAQVLAHHRGLQMSPKYVGIRPGEVVWSSLAIPWWQMAVRRYAVLAFISAMILFWAIPVAFVGLISNVEYLEQISFLTWLKDIPPVIMGVVTGLLPSVMLSILMSLVPIVMRRTSILCVCRSNLPPLTLPPSVRQAGRRALDVARRALHPKRLLCLPGHPGLPRRHPGLVRHRRRQADRRQPHQRPDHPGQQPAQGLQPVHLLLHRPGPDHRHQRAHPGRRLRRLYSALQVPGQHPARSLHQVVQPQRHLLGQHPARLHQHCGHRYVSLSLNHLGLC